MPLGFQDGVAFGDALHVGQVHQDHELLVEGLVMQVGLQRLELEGGPPKSSPVYGVIDCSKAPLANLAVDEVLFINFFIAAYYGIYFSLHNIFMEEPRRTHN